MSIIQPICQPICQPIVAKLTDYVGGGLGYAAIINDAGQLAPYVTFTRSSTATRYNSAGLLETVAANAPRYDYDPVTKVLRGLLIEEQRTNTIRKSQELNDALWLNSSVSVTANNLVAPDGTLTADKIVEDTSNGVHRMYFPDGVSVTSPFTYSIFLKSGERTSAFIGVGNSRYTRARVNLATGAFGAASGSESANLTFSATNVGNGWWRVRVSGTFSAADLGHCWITVADGTLESYTGNGTSGIYAWGAQGEAGAFATSYIPTTTAAVTRAASSATATTLSDIGFNASTGTLYFEGVAPPSVAVEATLASFNDNTANESIRLHMNAGGALRAQVIDGGVTVADLALGTLTARQSFKAALSYVENDIKGCLNGGTVQTDTSATLPTVDRLMIGCGSAGNAWNGHVRKLRYYRTAKNTQELTA